MTENLIYCPELLFFQGEFRENFEMTVDSQGRIARLGPCEKSSAGKIKLPRQALIPGLCNVHSHAFQRALRGLTQNRRDDDFWTWRKSMYHLAQNLSVEEVYDLSAFTFLEMLASGITTVGEFHYLHHDPKGSPYAEPNELGLQVLRAAHDVGIRICLLDSAYERAGFRRELEDAQRRFCDRSVDAYLKRFEMLKKKLLKDQSVGLAPHSVRAVPLASLKQIAVFAEKSQLPVHMHLHEQPQEIQECYLEYDSKSPIQVTLDAGLLNERLTAVHAVHTTAQDLFLLKKAGSGVCACPTTERDLGDGILDSQALTVRKIPICLGTDSQVLINLFEDARELEYHIRLKVLLRNVIAEDCAPVLFDAATKRGAKALALETGELAVGCWADFVALNLEDLSLVGATKETLLTQMIFSMSLRAIQGVYVAGREVIGDRPHPLAEELSRKFNKIQKRLVQ